MVTKHPEGCGQAPAFDETEDWEHWEKDGFHCQWTVTTVRENNYTCKWGTQPGDRPEEEEIDGLFHKCCLQREGFYW